MRWPCKREIRRDIDDDAAPPGFAMIRSARRHAIIAPRTLTAKARSQTSFSMSRCRRRAAPGRRSARRRCCRACRGGRMPPASRSNIASIEASSARSSPNGDRRPADRPRDALRPQLRRCRRRPRARRAPQSASHVAEPMPPAPPVTIATRMLGNPTIAILLPSGASVPKSPRRTSSTRAPAGSSTNTAMAGRRPGSALRRGSASSLIGPLRDARRRL